MSDAPQVEPLRLTLEEAIAILREHEDWALIFTGLGFVRIVADHGHGEWLGDAGTWPEAFSEALGVPVVPRDPAAELVEALEAVLHGGVIDEAAGLVSVDLGAYDAALAVLARVKGDT